MSGPVGLGRRAGLWGALFLLSTASAFVVIFPLRTGQVGYDSAASVLYFDRLVAGRVLEGWVTATPKPLLTVLYGAVHAVTGDWRPLSWLAIGAFGLAVVLATALVRRLAGPVSAGFAALAFIGSVTLVYDVSLAYAVVWALIGCLVAGLAVTSSRPRYGLAGAALLLASLARFETLLLVALVGAVLVTARVAAARYPFVSVPRRAWLVLLSLLAIPLQLAHDGLLTGDPLWSFSVPVVGSRGAPLIGPLGVARWTAERYAADGALVVLAVIGVIVLVKARRWPILIGLAALGPGTIAFLGLLAARDIYISSRYFASADIALLLTAAVGVSALRVPELARLVRRRAGRGTTAALAVVAGLTLGLVLPDRFAPLDASLRARVRAELAFHANATRALPVMRDALATVPSVRAWPSTSSLPPDAAGDPNALLVPTLLEPQLAVDLRIPLTQIAGTAAENLTTDGLYPAPGQFVYHDPRGDLPPDAFAFLEVAEPTSIGQIRLIPLLADEEHRSWFLRVETP